MEPEALELNDARITLADPAPFLRAVSKSPWFHLDLDTLQVVEMWALVALCALSRRERPDGVRCDVYERGSSNAGRFAHAVGFEAARDGAPLQSRAIERDRTVPVQRVGYAGPLEAVAKEIALIAMPEVTEADSRDSLAYVLVELLRNVVQHSHDPSGAVVGAQRMTAGKGGYSRPTVQVAVADTGQGILESLRRSHVIDDAETALEKALRPHISGVFPEGQFGGSDNAGLGLFFVSEMAKLTAGRLLLASRGAAIFLEGDEHTDRHRLSFLEPKGIGFPGTLAVFELPIEIVDHGALMDVVRERASERMPSPTARSWLTYGQPPEGTEVFVVRDVAEDTGAARTIAERMRALLGGGRAIALDFSGVRIATQSFLHALLFHPIRVGWAMGARIYVIDAEPAVRSGLTYLESYALT